MVRAACSVGFAWLLCSFMLETACMEPVKSPSLSPETLRRTSIREECELREQLKRFPRSQSLRNLLACYITGKNLESALLENSRKMVAVFSVIGAHPMSPASQRDNRSCSQLLLGIQCGQPGVTRKLLAAGFALEERDLKNTELLEHALIIAVAKKNYEGAKLLLSKTGVNVNCVDRAGHTPLMYAAKVHAHPLVMLLVEHGANVDSAWPCAVREGYQPILLYLKNHKPQYAQEATETGASDKQSEAGVVEHDFPCHKMLVGRASNS